MQDQIDNIELIPGPAGSPGEDGMDGQDGSSCSVIDTETGAIIECDDQTSATINDGTQSDMSLSCSNQRILANEIIEFRVDSECIIGSDLSLELEGQDTIGIHTYTITITNHGPDLYEGGENKLLIDVQRNMILEPFIDDCNGSFSGILSCNLPSIQVGENIVFHPLIEINEGTRPGFVLVSAGVNDTIEPLNESVFQTNNFKIIVQPNI